MVRGVIERRTDDPGILQRIIATPHVHDSIRAARGQ